MNGRNGEQRQDFGVVLFEKSNAKHVLDAPTGKVGAKGWVTRIYMILLGVGLFAWFLYSLIHAASDPETGVGAAIVSHIASFFVLFVAEFILMLTAFGAWGKFTRSALKKGLARQRGMAGVQNRQLEAEFAEADENKANECAIRVYRDVTVVVNDGVETLIHREELQRVRCEKTQRGFQLIFERYSEQPVVASLCLPLTDLPQVKKHFDNFEYTPAAREKGYFKQRLPMMAFMIVPVLIGVAIIVVHSLVLPDMPLIIGAGFLAIGLLLVLTQFSDVAVIGNGVIPIGAGLIFAGLPVAIALTVADMAESVSIASLFSYFSPLHAGLSLFLGLGPVMIIAGVAGIVDCARL